jgi:chromosome segregation ATPase
MSRFHMKRTFGSLRRLLRGRRAPNPSEQEWLRLILLVRRLQRGQLAFAERLDEMRTLSAALGSFRSDLGTLQEQLGAARESAGELEQGLGERLRKLPDPGAEHAALDRRVGALDAITARLETLAGQAPGAPVELGTVLARLSELAARFEGAQAAERAVGGQDELARLYERMLELAEDLARRPPPADLSDSAFARDAGACLARTAVQLEKLETSLQELATSTGADAHRETLERIEVLATRLERRSVGPGAAKELTALLNRFEKLANRMEQAPVALPELPPETVGGGPDPETARALEELRVGLLCEQESRRRVEEELESTREKLRASELARVELDTRHTAELAQMADHVGRQLHRVEEDLKKKKRGLAELTQQNIALQAEVARFQGGAKAGAGEPPAALPRAGGGALSQLMQAAGEGNEGAGKA